jgi:hypothetical protein
MSFNLSLVMLCVLTQTGGGQVQVRGRYINLDYAYSVTLPKDLVGRRSSAPSPNHGFGIDISKKDKSYLWADASHNAAEWRSYDDAVKARVAQLRGEGSTELKVVNRAATRLGRLKAQQYVIRYRHPESNVPLILGGVLAFRSNPGGVAIAYTIELITSEARYRRDRIVLELLRRSWMLRPLP